MTNGVAAFGHDLWVLVLGSLDEATNGTMEGCNIGVLLTLTEKAVWIHCVAIGCWRICSRYSSSGLTGAKHAGVASIHISSSNIILLSVKGL